MSRRERILYASYLGLLEPIPKSQVVPYLIGLSKTFDIILLSFEKKELLICEKEDHDRTSQQLKAAGIRWIRLRYHRTPRFFSSAFDIFVGAFVAYFVALRYRIKVFHARSNIPIAMGFLLKKILRIKLLYDRRGAMGDEHIENSGWTSGGSLHRFSKWFEKRAIQASDGIVVLTDRARIQLSPLIKRHQVIQTIPCCTDLNLFQRSETFEEGDDVFLTLKKKNVFVYCGSLGTYNLLPEMVNFFQIAQQTFSQSHLLILTKDISYAETFFSSFEGFDRSSVTIRSATRLNMPKLLSLSDVGLLFRQDSPTAIAASPTKLGEYLACGLPVVSLAYIGDVQEILTQNRVGVVLQRYSTEDYAQATGDLKALFENEADLRRRCRQVSERLFPLEGGIQKYSEVYRQLL